MADSFDIISFADNGLRDDRQVIVYKHPCEDFLTGTQLIVNDSQEAIFFMNGRALDTFPPGRHTLETQNLPMLGSIFHFGKGRTPFHCSVYFINKIGHISMKWGTSQSNIVEYQDPVYHFPLRLGARGEMHFNIEDSRRLMMKLVGTSPGLTKGELSGVIKDLLMMRFKNYMASLMTENNICIFQIDTYLESISATLNEALKNDFTEFGIGLERFLVVGFQKPEDDANYQRFKGLFFRQYADVTEAKLKQQVQLIEKETQGMLNAASASADPKDAVCAGCGAKLSKTAKFCPHCGKPCDPNTELPLVTCSNCGNRVHFAAFCESCGMPFYIECPQCRGKIQAESNFCPKCGVRLDKSEVRK